jgi:hypothetical protein
LFVEGVKTVFMSSLFAGLSMFGLWGGLILGFIYLKPPFSVAIWGLLAFTAFYTVLIMAYFAKRFGYHP